MILDMVDGGIFDIQEDKESYSGCETCDYGSEYVNSYDFVLTTIKIHIGVSQMYDFPLSQGQMMKILLPNSFKIKEMREREFAEWLEQSLIAEFAGSDKTLLALRDFNIKFEVTDL